MFVGFQDRCNKPDSATLPNWLQRVDSNHRPLGYEPSELTGLLLLCDKLGAGEGNRTLVVTLATFCSTIELHPQYGGDTRDRTADPLNANQVLSHLSYIPIIGRRYRIRTCDPLLPKQMRYQTAPISVKLFFFFV